MTTEPQKTYPIDWEDLQMVGLDDDVFVQLFEMLIPKSLNGQGQHTVIALIVSWINSIPVPLTEDAIRLIYKHTTEIGGLTFLLGQTFKNYSLEEQFLNLLPEMTPESERKDLAVRIFCQLYEKAEMMTAEEHECEQAEYDQRLADMQRAANDEIEDWKETRRVRGEIEDVPEPGVD